MQSHNVGGNLGVRLATSGFVVKFGVRAGSDVKDLLSRAGARAEIHLDPSLGGTVADVFLAGDDAEAKKAVAAVAEAAGFTPVDSGPLRNAAVLENLAILWIHLALREGHGRSWAFKKVNR